MKNDTRRVVRASILVGVIALVGSVLLCPSKAAGQSAGNNAIYNSSGTCSPNCAASPAFIDASVFIGNGTKQSSNICGAIYGILSSNFYAYPAAGAVVDARGISGTAALTCAAGTTPWNNGTTTVSVPSNILLPAGTIVISTGWVLPANTHLFGQGDNISSGTVIQAASNVGDMIAYCSSVVPPQNPPPSSCTGIGVEKLVLDGKGNSVNGIVNYYAGSLSYVDHVSLYQILDTGLVIGGVATGSGPYSNINFDTGNATATSSTVCAQIVGPALQGTAGIRGLSCTSEKADAPAAVLLDSSSNSIKDVTIVGFEDGILVGAHQPAQSNVLINIIGDTGCPSGCTIKAIHISSNQTNGSNNVQDLSIVGVGNDVTGTYTIWDELTGAFINDPFVGLYVLGKPANNGYARLTTSPGYPTWAVGTAAPSTSAMCARGSLYSCTGFGSTGGSSCNNTNNTPIALWGCPTGSGWVGIE